ncbi:hypothetical protein E1B28_002861 [Marasmius oreades]|uniref:Uncharacterized protein n=1 Tax=Marasmius oreades TaxID=181124 RepID=A0A9P7UPD4_9AGAR|nr:uncharacterized protein E1B28_002861 [Marasmius oreades]KAG7086944.1 hypothetical protein E1B28_002861 [Marasmius oreades]
MASRNSIPEAYRISVTFWIPMHFTSLAGIILIQLTTWFARLVRGRVWYGFMTSLAIFCLSSCLLYISGQQPTSDLDQAPNYFLCLTQAALVYSDEPLAIHMLLSLLLELYWKVSSAHSQNGKTLEKHKRASSPWLLILPYASWCLLTIAFLVFGLRNPSKVVFSGHNPYCALDQSVPRIFNSVVCAILLLATMIVLAMIAVRLVMIKINCQSQPQTGALPSLGEYLGLFIRFTLILIFGVIAVIISIIFAIEDNSPIMYHVIAQAGVPLVAMIIFGSQKDVLLVWRDLGRRCLGRVRTMGMFRLASGKTSMTSKCRCSNPVLHKCEND